MDYNHQVNSYLRRVAKDRNLESTLTIPELIYQVVFIEKITPEKVRNTIIFEEYTAYIKENRYGKAYIYDRLSTKFDLSVHWVKEIVYNKLKNEG